MGPKAPRLSSHARDESGNPNLSPFTAPSPRLEHAGVQTRAQAAREAKLRTPPPAQPVESEEAPSTPLHQGIPPQTTSEAPGAPRKTKARRTTNLSPGAPVRKLDFDNHPLLKQQQHHGDSAHKNGSSSGGGGGGFGFVQKR